MTLDVASNICQSLALGSAMQRSIHDLGLGGDWDDEPTSGRALHSLRGPGRKPVPPYSRGSVSLSLLTLVSFGAGFSLKSLWLMHIITQRCSS
jgi:hypothetical protein